MTIPRYPDFAAISLEHKSELDALFAESEPSISEFTFTNLFIWRYHYRLMLSRLGSHVLFLAQQDGKDAFFFPPWGPGDKSNTVRECAAYLRRLSGGGHFERVPDASAAEARSSVPDLEVLPDPGNDEYVYSSQDLATLGGRHFDGKRNAVSKFRRAYPCEYRPIEGELVRKCLELEDHWCVDRNCPLYPGLSAEEHSIHELFAYWDHLKVRGGAILIDERVVAFSAGEKLNSETFVVHIEKADPEFPGAYAMINQEFARAEGSKLPFINREQDLGEEGLRIAKQSYRPVKMVKKYRLVVPQDTASPIISATH